MAHPDDENTPYWLSTVPTLGLGDGGPKGPLDLPLEFLLSGQLARAVSEASNPPIPPYLWPMPHVPSHMLPLAPPMGGFGSNPSSPTPVNMSADLASPPTRLPPSFAPASPLEHLDSAKYWGASPALPEAPSPSSAHGFYVSPMPQPPSWDAMPDASTTGLGQISPQLPGGSTWNALSPGATGYSPTDEASMADDARRVAADRLRRGMQRKIPSAPPPDHLSPSNPLVHGFYLSPVGQAPSWEQVVPTATPWSVSPKLPSPTAWGDTISGPQCYTSDGKLTCTTPGGRRFTVPAQGLVDGLEIAPGHPDYHYYNVPVSSRPGDPRSHMPSVIDNPTPGPNPLVSPSTPEGTRNEAAPWYVHLLPRNPLEYFTEGATRWPVKSYRTTDQNGMPMVVNVTQPGHPLYPGVVARYETTSPSGSTIHHEGTGLALIQGPRSPIPKVARDWANDYIWRVQSENIMNGFSTHRPKGLPLGK